MTMRIVIVDDEPLARERLKRLLAEIPECEVAGEAGNGLAALGKISTLNPDVVLLDIRMPGMDGIECAQHLAALETPPAVIFTTAYGEYALDAFRVHAVGYLLKPVRQDELSGALVSARRLTRPQLQELATASGQACRNHISARVRGQIVLIPVADILYFQADQKYVTVRHLGGEVLIEESLKALEEEFSGRFIRIHRNALVAREHLSGLQRDEEGRQFLVFRAIPERLEISRRHFADVRALLKAV